jgi:DNA polymerase
VVKCRPPGNRDPLPEEIAACQPHLMAQIEVIRPRVICTLGRFATRLLADTQASMNSVRGRAKETEVAGVPVTIFPVFHPAAALYTPANRALLEEDFRKLKHLLQRGYEALADPGRRPPPVVPPVLDTPEDSQAGAPVGGEAAEKASLAVSQRDSTRAIPPECADTEQLPLF